jgi:Domain of unknown function (DUF1906)
MGSCAKLSGKHSSANAGCGPAELDNGTTELATFSLPAHTVTCGSTSGKSASSQAACGTNETAANVTKGRVKDGAKGHVTGTITPLVTYSVSLAASSTYVGSGATVTLTATSSVDVGTTPYFILLFTSSGTFLKSCGSGTSCSTPVSHSGSANIGYVAYISGYSTTAPPPNIQATSNTVTVHWMTISISASPTYMAPGATTTITAATTADVGPSPWYIDIFDKTTGQIATCATGTFCQLSVSHSVGQVDQFVAYVASKLVTNPPPNIQATSSTISVVWFSITLSASPASLAAGGTTTLTATTNADVGPSPYFISIYDSISSARMTFCGSGASCGVSVSFSGATVHSYVAYVSGSPPATGTPPSIKATSSTVTVRWFTISLSANPKFLAPGASTTLTATASTDVGPTPYFIQIYDNGSKARVASCAIGTTCTTSVSQSAAGVFNYIAYIGNSDATAPPSTTIATSSTVKVVWLSVTLTASDASLADGRSMTLIATANTDLSTSPYFIEIFDQTTGAFIDECGLCSSLTTSAISQSSPGTHTFAAYISGFSQTFPPPNIQASATKGVTWYMWGVDSCNTMTQSFLDSVTSTYGVPEFWGRYIVDKPLPICEIDSGANIDVDLAHDQGIAILPIYNKGSGFLTTYATGQAAAAEAIDAAEALGIPHGRVIMLDVESNANIDANFIRGWYDSLVGTYVPGYYENPYSGSGLFPAAYCSAVGTEPAIGTGAILWSDEPSGTRTGPATSPNFAPDKPSCTNHTYAWQYAIAGSGGGPSVDTDEALASVPLWYP